MTKDEALKLALDAIENISVKSVNGLDGLDMERLAGAATALREALALTSTTCEVQPEQEPVAWMHDVDGRVDVIHSEVKALWQKVGQPNGFYREKVPCKVEHYTIPLYAAPPKREWVGLTDDGRRECTQSPFADDNFRTIEAKLKELNEAT